jgi:hypothetical protein
MFAPRHRQTADEVNEADDGTLVLPQEYLVSLVRFLDRVRQ